ncbi:efflux RND transporter periplasmic adaptor subunit [Candidatus Uabimicrobium amorphum]|uniref:Hemolysin secretion protein D n=1 Tax=Uabimicrobium amorphum TaxID=2596890 RepID=A0A5S9IKJ7_UABAM|nr:efflux RND transporter periplasmic adaptor subunit [Candidatus Uabimicrobium amorphum]BBM83062.1 hemolysin secretion protein D [Candidatus Uabimicrobium amorphum]
MRTHTRKLLELSSLCILVVTFCCSCEQKVDYKNEFLKTVTWIKLQKQKNTSMRKMSGVVQPADTTDVSFEMSGKVAGIYFDLGKKFRKGDLLAKLDDRIIRLTAKQRQNEYLEAKASLIEFKDDYKRKKDLVNRGSVSKSEYDIAVAKYKTAIRRIDIAKARLEIARENWNDTHIRAPYNGSISKRYMDPPKYLNAGEPVLQIQKDRGLEVAILAPETIINNIRVGQKARVIIPAITRKTLFLGRVSKIGSRAENANAFPVQISLLATQKENQIKPGMSAQVALRFPQTKVTNNLFRVPITAFAAGEKQSHYLLVIRKQKYGGQLQRIPVEVKEVFDQEVLVTGNLKTGQRIVRTGLSYLRHGQKVRLLGQQQILYNE